MKTSKLKVLLATLLIGSYIMAGSSIAFGNDPPSATSLSVKYQKENSSISKDISSINLLKANINSLEEKKKADVKAGNKTEVVMDKRALMKRKADLKQQKTYLKADKMDLVKDHKIAICEVKAAVNKDQSKVRTAQRQLKKDMAAGNEAAIENDAKLLVQQQRVLNRDKVALENERQSLDSDMVALKNQLNPKTDNTSNASSYARAD